MAIKMPREDMFANSPASHVEGFLRAHSKDGYTINGILVEAFGADPEKLNGPWNRWPATLPTLYGRVRRTLDRLHAAGRLTKTKIGKAVFWAWKED